MLLSILFHSPLPCGAAEKEIDMVTEKFNKSLANLNQTFSITSNYFDCFTLGQFLDIPELHITQ